MINIATYCVKKEEVLRNNLNPSFVSDNKKFGKWLNPCGLTMVLDRQTLLITIGISSDQEVSEILLHFSKALLPELESKKIPTSQILKKGKFSRSW